MVLLPTDRMDSLFSPRCVWVNGPIIVGAGPSGLAVAASLREQSVPFVMLERADCIASLWQKRTYDRLKLYFPKQFCELPRMPFPEHYPEYPTRRQFIDYLENNAAKFDIKPEFNHTVLSARYDETSGLWRVQTAAAGSEMEYIGRWLVVATGENDESVVPNIKTEFNHTVLSVRFDETSGLWRRPPPGPRPPTLHPAPGHSVASLHPESPTPSPLPSHSRAAVGPLVAKPIRVATPPASPRPSPLPFPA